MEAAAEARASTTPELLARQRRALKPTTGAPATTNAVVVTEASLRTFYEQHNPANTAPDRLKIVLKHYDGRHDKLIHDLSKRYGAAASAALCAVGQQLYADDKENVAPSAAVATVTDNKENAPPPRRSKQLSHDADKENVPPASKSPVKAARRRHTITSPYRPRAAPAPLRAPQRRSVDTCVPPEVEVPKTLKPKASPPVTTPSVRHVPEVSPPKVWPPSINLADRLAQAVKARFFCDAAAEATVETVSVATSPITVPSAATFVPPRRRRLGVVVAATVAVAFVACAALGRAPSATKPAKTTRPRRVAWPERVAPGACVHLTRRHLACAPPAPPPPPKLLLTEPKPKGVLAKRVRSVLQKAAKPALVSLLVAPVGPVWAWRMGRLARAVPAVAQLTQAQAVAAYWFCGAAGFGVCALAGMMI